MMQTSDYTEYFELLHVAVKTDEWGNQTDVEKVIYAGYAKVLNLSGREYWDAMAAQAENTLKFHCRWVPVFEHLDTTTHKLKWRDRLLDITAVDNIEHGNELCTIKAKEVRHDID